MSTELERRHAATRRALLAWADFLGFGHVAYGALLIVVGDAHDRAVRRGEPSDAMRGLHSAVRSLHDDDARDARGALRDSAWAYLDAFLPQPDPALRHAAAVALLVEATRGRP